MAALFWREDVGEGEGRECEEGEGAKVALCEGLEAQECCVGCRGGGEREEGWEREVGQRIGYAL